MPTNLLTSDEYRKEQALLEQNGPRWFLLSYDAGEEIREERMNEQFKRVSYVIAHQYTTEDFRKRIIRTLRKAKVEKMDEPVETSIFFKDPRTNMSIETKLDFWKKEFDGYGENFNYILVAAIQKNGEPYFVMNPITTLQKNFQKLLIEVKKEEDKK